MTSPIIIYFDTEFTNLVPRALRGTYLISAGFVTDRDEAETLYFEINGAWTVEDCSPFVIETVLPLLEGGKARMLEQAASANLIAWIKGLEVDVELMATSPLDREYFFDLVPPDLWPENLKAVRIVSFDNLSWFWRLRAKSAEERFFQMGGRRHHALDDAKALRAGWLNSVPAGRIPRADSGGTN